MNKPLTSAVFTVVLLTASSLFADKPALRRAIEDLAATFPDKYTRAQEFLQRLDQVKTDAGLEALAREALLANPLLDFDRVLAIKRGVGNLGLPHNFLSNSSIPKAGYDNALVEFSIHRRMPDRIVFQPSGTRFVGDLCLHFDATRVLFSMPNEERWQIHEIRLDGAGLRQVTPKVRDDIDNYDACYLPDGDILFTSTLCMSSVPCVAGGAHVANLCRLFTANGKIRQLCFDQEHDWCPRVMPNGAVLYQRWEYTDTPHSNTRLLMTMNPDGTNQREFYGSNSYWPAAFFYATPLPGAATKVIGVSGGHHGDARQGELYILDAGKSRREDEGVVCQIPSRPATPSGRGKIYDHMLNVWPRFLHPCPLSEKYFLVSCRPSPRHAWGIYLVDVFDNFVLLKETPGYAMFEPVALTPRSVPPVIPDRVQDDRKDATIYIADIYAGPGLAGIPRGTVKELRVFTYVYSYHGVGGLLGVVGMDGPWDVRRMLGTVPVNSDGSVRFRVPANVPLSIQPLDQDGQALALMRSWMTARPGEQLSCVGCHENPSMSPPARRNLAFSQKRPAEIQPWHVTNTGFAFEQEVQPVLDRHCVSCHDGAKTKPDLRGGIALQNWHSAFAGSAGRQGYGGKFSTSYANLFPFVRNNGIEGDYHLLAPMEFHFSATELGRMLRKGHYGVQLDTVDFRRLVTWSDLNRPYHGSWATIVGPRIARSGEQRAECREQFADLNDPYKEVTPPAPRENTAPIPPAPQPPLHNPAKLPNWTFKATAQPEMILDLGEGQTISLVRIPAGQFVMGSTTGHRDEQPVSLVTIARPFWMAKCEITNAQFRRFDPSHDSAVADALAYQFGRRPWSLNKPQQPVCRVSYNESCSFCAWLAKKTGKRIAIPTEAQWEWACRAGAATEFSFGGKEADYASFANLGDRSLKKFCADTSASGYHALREIANPGPFDDWIPKDDTHDDHHQLSSPVGSYQPNGFGLFDMHGNVSEWTCSPYQPYPYRDVTAGAKEERVVRGGSWYDRPMHCTSSYRFAYRPYQKVFNVGFRIILEEEWASQQMPSPVASRSKSRIAWR
jgi:formylglycine-generating enzyme required for sulfatase activity